MVEVLRLVRDGGKRFPKKTNGNEGSERRPVRTALRENKKGRGTIRSAPVVD
jgi:hypothetical protein